MLKVLLNPKQPIFSNIMCIRNGPESGRSLKIYENVLESAYVARLLLDGEPFMRVRSCWICSTALKFWYSFEMESNRVSCPHAVQWLRGHNSRYITNDDLYDYFMLLFVRYSIDNMLMSLVKFVKAPLIRCRRTVLYKFVIELNWIVSDARVLYGNVLDYMILHAIASMFCFFILLTM